MKKKYTLEEIKERMHNGTIYQCNSEELTKEQVKQLDLQFEFNHTKPSDIDRKHELLKEMFASIGSGSYIETPLHANWAGKFVHIGKNFYANFNLTLVDDCEIAIGNSVMIAPNVTICAGTHPVNPNLRREVAQYNLPVHIGNNVWIGAGAIIMPGVRIGDNTVIGAGSIVTKDIPSDVVAFGNPCRVIREISEEDYKVDWDTNFKQ